MKLFVIFVSIICFWATNICSASVVVLTYHELDNTVANNKKDIWSASSSNFEKHVQYFKKQEYRFISLDEYIEYCKGNIQLPEKTVMLTFDDGYESFYTKALPVLKKYNVPAMLSVVSSWIEGQKPPELRKLVTWEQLRELEAMKLVTVVSHTDSLHVQRVINPQGGFNSCIENRLYFQDRYENDLEYDKRIRNDFEKVQQLFKEKLGHSARALVWPYGKYSGKAVQIARECGFESMFMLDGGINNGVEEDLHYAKRMIIYDNPDVNALRKMINNQDSNMRELVLAQVDLDGLYDRNSEVMAANVEELVNRLGANNIKTVALQTFADDDGDGNVDEVYFFNNVVPIKADIFNYVSNILLQNNIKVFAWMPTLAFSALIEDDNSNLVAAVPASKQGWYKRFSPFDVGAEKKLEELYRELGKYSNIDGILLQDDLYLNDFEDFSPVAKKAYLSAFGSDLNTDIRENSKQMQKWSNFKTERMTKLSEKVIAAIKENRPRAYTARNIYTAVVQDREAEQWFGQNMEQYLKTYDFTILMAYDHMDNREEDYDLFLSDLVQKTKEYGSGIEKTVFKIQTFDWKSGQWINKEHLKSEVELLKKLGVKHIGYYPDSVYI
ncbi:poly-beta-1,6-N-acetyl-D-glucosamine N-deacetylase PgaB [Phascolarctobacterium sp.]